MPNNKLLLNIAGLSILITTSEDETYTRELADELDRDINNILNANMGASVTNAALLCAISYLDNAKKSAKNANNMRNQVKDYMDDAAKAKFKYDEEHKRVSELTVEIQSLRSHLTRLATEGDSSGVVENIKKELAAATRDLEDMRDKAGKIAAANKALNEKSAAMNDYIAGQDKELARLGSIITELNATISRKDEQLATLAAHVESITDDNRSLKSENARLNTEMYTMEQALTEDRAKNRELSAQLAELRLSAEAAKAEAENSVFVPADLFSAPLSDELGEAEEPSPVLFDYEEPVEDAMQPEQPAEEPEAENPEMEQMSFEDSVVIYESAPATAEEEAIIFDDFQVSDIFLDEDGALHELTEEEPVYEEPQMASFEAEEKPLFTGFSDEDEEEQQPLFTTFTLDDPSDDPDMPDLSWTLEV